jgi:tRNA threonylcarbamoyladenosine biosynthesis protein TsaB
MRILAIETSELFGSVAALEGDAVAAAADLDPTMRSAQSLAPGIVALLDAVGWQPAQIEMVAVGVGPGSFTGLRVGVATAKLLAYSVGAAVMGVNTLEAIALQAEVYAEELWTVLDAQRNQVFAGLFARGSDDAWQWQRQTQLLDQGAWLAQLSPGQGVSGPALKKLAAQLPAGVVPADRALWEQKATVIGQLAWRQYESGRRDDVFSLLPEYFRPSAAEEKLAGAENAQK